jgi:RNA polymerase sigma-70 factor (ECF subfamily)
MPAESVEQTVPEGLSDEQVIARVLAGERPLYEIIMRRYNTRLYRVVRSIVRDDGEVEDVVQDTYVRAFQHLDQFAARAKFSTWLTRIALHEALARARKAKRFERWDFMSEREQYDTASDRLQPNPESQAASGELGHLLEQAIQNLPQNYRAVVMMRDVEEMTTSEVAECLSISEENVKVRLHRAHAVLRKELYAKAELTASQLFPFHAVRCDRVVSNVFSRLAAL